MNIKKLLNEVWPGKVSVILPIGEGMPPAQRKQLLTKFSYLHRGTGTLAFRLPRPASLRSLLAATGPLVAPSANLEGEPPAKTIREAKQYFGDGVEFYLDAGRKEGKASKIFKMEGGTIQRIR